MTEQDGAIYVLDYEMIAGDDGRLADQRRRWSAVAVTPGPEQRGEWLTDALTGLR